MADFGDGGDDPNSAHSNAAWEEHMRFHNGHVELAQVDQGLTKRRSSWAQRCPSPEFKNEGIVPWQNLPGRERRGQKVVRSVMHFGESGAYPSNLGDNADSDDLTFNFADNSDHNWSKKRPRYPLTYMGHPLAHHSSRYANPEPVVWPFRAGELMPGNYPLYTTIRGRETTAQRIQRRARQRYKEGGYEPNDQKYEPPPEEPEEHPDDTM